MQKVVYRELRDRDIYLDINAGQWMTILKGLAARWVAWRRKDLNPQGIIPIAPIADNYQDCREKNL